MGNPGHIFISYTKPDERWAEWIAWQLEQAGLKTRLMAWDFRPGTDFVTEMHRALRECDRTLAVLSPDYLKSAFCQPEWTATFAADPTAEEHKLLLVRVTECKPDGLLKTRVYVDLVGLKDEAAARERLIAGISTARAKPITAPAFPGGATPAATTTRTPPAFPAHLPPVWTVPFSPNPFFTGREDALRTLRERLVHHSSAAITQPQAVHGLGGVGKTELAAEYAWRHRANYDAVLWAVADSPAALDANLAALARSAVLNLTEAEAKEQPIQTDAVLRWLRSQPRWLLVLDSADTREAAAAVGELLAGPLPGHVIVTTRRTDWGIGIEPLPVDSLPVDVAANFLLKRTKDRGFDAGQRADALKLARELGGLPLALEQAAAYVIRHRVTFSEYVKRLETIRHRLLSEATPGGTRYPRSVAETWLASEAQLCLPARAILRLAAFLAPDDIPRSLVTDGNRVLNEAAQALAAETGKADAPLNAEAALVELADYSLITLETAAFSCHRLVQAVQSDRLTEDARRCWTKLALRWVNDAVPGIASDVRSWPAIEPLRVHAETVVTLAEQIGLTDPTARLLNQIGLFLKTKALNRQAEPLYRRALAIDEQNRSSDHPEVATNLNNLAQLLQDTNRLAEAEPMMRRALAIFERSFGPNHPEVAACLNNMARLYQDRNQITEVEPLYLRALTIYERDYGPDHPAVATCLTNRAQFLSITSRLVEAEPLMRRALAIDERFYGPDHPNVARDINNLALLLQDTNRVAEAEPLCRRALAIDEKNFGPNHPKLAIRLNNLASLLSNTHRLAEAEPLMRRALAIDEQNYGPHNPNVARDLNNLAKLLHDTRRWAEAEPLLRRALTIDQESLGADHPVVAANLNNLTLLLQATNRLVEAEPLMRKHVVILRNFGESTGHEHPHMQDAIGNYRTLLAEMKLSPAQIEAKVREVLNGPA